MPESTPGELCWGQEHFGTARLRDKRRTRSLVDLAQRIHGHPGGSLPDKLADPKALQRCYDLMNCPAVTHDAVLEPHRQRTLRLARQHPGVLLFVRDNTELDLTGKLSLADDLGPLSSARQRGYICHNVLVVNPADRSVLGLAQQLLHVRYSVPEGETQAQRRQRESRESRLWLQGLTAAPAPEGALWVDVADAASDTFEFLDFEDLQGCCYLVRCAFDRRIWVGHDGQHPRSARAKGPSLYGHLRTLPGLARRPIEVPARDGRPARTAEVSVAWAAVQVRPPEEASGEHRNEPLKVWAVRVWEASPPEGAEPVEWFLLTNLETATAEQAWERVDWYTCRWVVEELHKAMKSGCDIEAPQFTTAEAMQPMLALLSVVATALLNVRDLSRRAETRELPAERYVDREYVAILSGWRYQEGRPLTVQEFYLALARLGGHLNRKHDHPPGWLVLWRGWTKLHLLVEGARAAGHAARSPSAFRDNPDGS